MTWTASLREAKKTAGKWDVSIIYTNGVDTVIKGYEFVTGITDDQIKSIARAECESRNNAEVSSTTVSGAIDTSRPVNTPSPPPPIPPPPSPVIPYVPTQEEIDRAAWFAAFDNLQRYRFLADHGLLSQTDSRITALVTTLKTTWLNGYFKDLPL